MIIYLKKMLIMVARERNIGQNMLTSSQKLLEVVMPRWFILISLKVSPEKNEIKIIFSNSPKNMRWWIRHFWQEKFLFCLPASISKISMLFILLISLFSNIVGLFIGWKKISKSIKWNTIPQIIIFVKFAQVCSVAKFCCVQYLLAFSACNTFMIWVKA